MLRSEVKPVFEDYKDKIELLDKVRARICAIQISNREKVILLAGLSEVRALLKNEKFDPHRINQKFSVVINSLNECFQQKKLSFKFHNQLFRNLSEIEGKREVPAKELPSLKVNYVSGQGPFEEITKGYIAQQSKPSFFKQLVIGRNEELKRKVDRSFV